MVSSQLSDVRVRLLSGSIVIDLINKSSKDSVSILWHQAVVQFDKPGLYRIDDRPGEPPLVKVFRGRALISAFGSEHAVKSKQFMLLTKSVAGESSLHLTDPSWILWIAGAAKEQERLPMANVPGVWLRKPRAEADFQYSTPFGVHALGSAEWSAESAEGQSTSSLRPNLAFNRKYARLEQRGIRI